MADINPLALIGRSQIGAPDNSALQKLQAGNFLQQLQGKQASDLARQNNTSRTRDLGITHNLPLTRAEIAGDLSPGTVGKLDQTRGITDAETAAKGFYSARSAGIGRQFPEQAFELKDIGKQIYVSGLPLMGELANKAAAEAKRGTEHTSKGYGFDANGRFREFTKKETFEQKGKIQASPEAKQRAQALLEAARKHFAGRDVQVSKDATSDRLILTVDGQPTSF